jgi:NADPH-dependent glutamate synthase beta subunit-like oxidoreductase
VLLAAEEDIKPARAEGIRIETEARPIAVLTENGRLVGLRCQDVVTGSGAHVRCRGKGRKERCTPLRREAVAVLCERRSRTAGI